MEDTIAAISTPLGAGGIAIVRVSGPHALNIADAVFRSSSGKPSLFPSHTIHYGRILQNGTLVDQVMLAVFRAPHSYTTEDTVEINCHGGVLTAQSILSLCLQHGARSAEPGEFTKRAFLNGRLDLTQAEAVMDLISARTQRAQAVAARTMEGHLFRRVEALREKVASLLAHVEAHLDFPDEDISPATQEQLHNALDESIALLQKLLATACEGRILREGIVIVIIGRPNVGKSSLMNALLGRDRSIVTPVPGTTRDSIEDVLSLGGLPIRLTDTAGYRKARGMIETNGVNRTIKVLQQAEIVLHVIDVSRPSSSLDIELTHLCDSKYVIQVLNKSDLPSKYSPPPALLNCRYAHVSALTGCGLESLKTMIVNGINEAVCGFSGFDVAINERHFTALSRALSSLVDAKKELSIGREFDIISQQIRLSLSAIGEVVGKTTREDVLERVFDTFCIGK
jgi:tRNA modification GTPase